MGKYMSGLLSCSLCGSDNVEFKGKEGAILKTKCHACGITSDTLTSEYLNNNPEPEVYYEKAPASTPPSR
jgi:hypothetical protein